MWNKSYKHPEIQDSLSVSSGFISQWTQRYQNQGIASLKLAHRRSNGYLNPEQRSTVIQWLQTKEAWHLPELQIYLEDEYDIVFKSKQSYYNLLSEAGLSWKKTQKRNPKTDPELVKKTALTDWLEERRDPIESGKLAVFFQDECHLLWGDLWGDVWGKTDERNLG
jgi:transposase